MAKKLTKNQQVEVKTDVAKETATAIEETKVETKMKTEIDEETKEEVEETEIKEDVITVDTDKKEEKVVVKETETTSKKTQMAKIRMREAHKCFIGGEWYFLEKDKCYNVPENVKRILGDAGLLAPL